MARQPNGDFTLPLPPVVSGTTVEATWANTSFNDFSAAFTDSLSRSGQGNMSAPLLVIDGTVLAPGLAFGSEANSGLRRDAPGDIYMTVLGQDYMRWTDDNGVQTSVDGIAWNTVATNDVVTPLAEGIITDITWADNILNHVRTAGDFAITIDTFDTIKSDGSIRHLSTALIGSSVAPNITAATRFTIVNNGAITVTFNRPTGADPDLGEDYCVEGSILITNTATPDVVTINNDAGAVPAANILGTQNQAPNGVMVLSYVIHRHAGDTYDEIYSWAS